MKKEKKELDFSFPSNIRLEISCFETKEKQKEILVLLEQVFNKSIDKSMDIYQELLEKEKAEVGRYSDEICETKILESNIFFKEREDLELVFFKSII